MIRRVLPSAASAPPASLLFLALLAAAGPAAAQRDKAPANDPASCPYCENDPELMGPAGVVSHGGFEFGNHDTAATDRYLATADIRWIETEHFEIGMALAGYRPPQKEKKAIRAELTEMAEVLPTINPKTRLLDPWLRAHMFAWRAEKAWDRMLEILQVTEDQFPDGTVLWDMTGPYMGEGPYLGQKGKYEILMLPSEALHYDYLVHEFGLPMKKTQRWNVVDRDTLTVVMHEGTGPKASGGSVFAQDDMTTASLKRDPAMHGHVVFNLAHNFLDGYKHYSYDTPIWIHEGLAHFMEREISPEYNSFDSSEGGIAAETKKSKWHQEVLKIVKRGNAPRLAELMALKNYAELELVHHFCTWSMIKYLIEEHPEGFAGLLADICGIMDENGYADGSNLPDKHRKAFKERLGMSYPEFDKAWRDWVLGIEPEPEDDVPLPLGGG